MRLLKEKAHHWNRLLRASTPLLILPACLVMLFLAAGCQKAADSASAVEAVSPERTVEEPGAGNDGQVLVTYFFTTYRCASCILLETYSAETVEKGFPERVRDGELAYRSLNVDDPENRHFVEDYRLYTKSVVVSLNRNGKEVRWKNLPDIWKHLRSRDRFEQYLKSEIEAYLKEL